MQNTPSVVALRDALTHAGRSLATSAYTVRDEALRAKVCEVVDDFKAFGWPPERVIIAVKQIVEEAGLTQTHRVLLKNADLDAHDLLIAKVIRWTVECYYDPHESMASA